MDQLLWIGNMGQWWRPYCSSTVVCLLHIMRIILVILVILVSRDNMITLCSFFHCNIS
jgi:hypothetical protein